MVAERVSGTTEQSGDDDDAGTAGCVVGIDISTRMLEMARARIAAWRAERPDVAGAAAARVELVNGDVATLELLNPVSKSDGESSLLQLEAASFDWILCSNAFVQIGDPAALLRHWASYLSPGGRVVIDIPHERSPVFVGARVLHRALRRMQLGMRSGRLIQLSVVEDEEGDDGMVGWVRSENSFADVLAAEGFEVERCEILDKKSGRPTTTYTVEDADAQFDYVVESAVWWALPSEDREFRARTLPFFREEWAKEAVDGRIETAEALYVYVARKNA